MNETKLKHMVQEGNKKAGKLSALTEQPAKFLSTIQVAITLAGLLGGAFAADHFADPLIRKLRELGVALPEQVLRSIVVLVITLILTYFSLVFGELVPKRIAMKKTEKLALGMSGLLYGVSVAFAPLVWLCLLYTSFPAGALTTEQSMQFWNPYPALWLLVEITARSVSPSRSISAA